MEITGLHKYIKLIKDPCYGAGVPFEAHIEHYVAILDAYKTCEDTEFRTLYSRASSTARTALSRLSRIDKGSFHDELARKLITELMAQLLTRLDTCINSETASRVISMESPDDPSSVFYSLTGNEALMGCRAVLSPLGSSDEIRENVYVDVSRAEAALQLKRVLSIRIIRRM